MKLKATTKLMLMAWVPLLQLISILLIGLILIDLRLFPDNWVFMITMALMIATSFVAAWKSIDIIKKTTIFQQPKHRTTAVVLYFLNTMILPLLFIFSYELGLVVPQNMYSEVIPKELLLIGFLVIIPAVASLIVYYLIKREAMMVEPRYRPVVKFTLYSISMLWFMNMVFHGIYRIPLDIMPVLNVNDAERFHAPNFAYSELYEPSITNYLSIKPYLFSAFVIISLLFFGSLLFNGIFKDRQNQAFSKIGLTMVTVFFGVHFLITKAWLSSSDFPGRGDLTSAIIPVSFTTIAGPVLLVAMVLVLIGGILSCMGKSFKKIRFSNRRRSTGIALSLVALLLYIVLFKGVWPFRDPAIHLVYGVFKNHQHDAPFPDMRTIVGAYQLEFFLYSRKGNKSMLRDIDSFNNSFKQFAAFYFRYFGDQEAAPTLIQWLKNENEWVRRFSAEALGHIKNRRAVEPLIDALVERKDIYSYAFALEKLADPRAIEPLLKRLDDENEYNRRAVVEALSVFKSPVIVEKLIQRLEKEVGEDNIMWSINGALKKTSGLDKYPKDLYKKDSDGPQWAQWWRQWLNENQLYRYQGQVKNIKKNILPGN